VNKLLELPNEALLDSILGAVETVESRASRASKESSENKYLTMQQTGNENSYNSSSVQSSGAATPGNNSLNSSLPDTGRAGI
jgi:hypothetical protein